MLSITFECFSEDRIKMKTSDGKFNNLKFSFQVDMGFDKSGSNKAMQEFFPDEQMFCIVMLKSGFLKMSGCMLSLE